MTTRITLEQPLVLAAAELRSQLPPATLLPAIHHSLDRGAWHVPAWRERWLAWFGWAGLSTGAVAIAAALVVNAVLPVAPPASAADADGFVRLVSQDAWQRAQADNDRGWLIDTELPQARLATLGVPYDPARAGERVPAQLLVRSSGEVLAVRFTR